MIARGKAVTFSYITRDDQGQVIDSSEDSGNISYLHGLEDIIPGIESALEGKTVGDAMSLNIPPEQAYGEYDPSMVGQVSRDQFPGVEQIEPGMAFQTQLENGSTMVIQVKAVEGDMITVDGNHPMAGKSLHMDLKVEAVRDASAEEKSHGHVHGEGGHQHD